MARRSWRGVKARQARPPADVMSPSWRHASMPTSSMRCCRVRCRPGRGWAVRPATSLLVRTPGAFELPAGRKRLAETGRYDAVVALGCVIRGDTAAFRVRCRRSGARHCARRPRHGCAGDLRRSHHRERRAGAGTCHAVERMDKGGEALEVALEMALTLRADRRAMNAPTTDPPVRGRASTRRALCRANSRCRRCIAGSSTAASWQDLMSEFDLAEDAPRADREFFQALVQADLSRTSEELDALLTQWCDRPANELDPIEHAVLYDRPAGTACASRSSVSGGHHARRWGWRADSAPPMVTSSSMP